MNTRILTAGLLPALLLFTSSAFAQDGFAGQFELDGRYSSRRSTSVDLKIYQHGSGSSLGVIRTAKITSGRHRSDDPFTWSGSARVSGRIMKVVYEVPVDPNGDVTDFAGMITRLDPDSSSTSDALALLGQKNVIEAVYILSANGQEIREIAKNTTRLGPQRGWRWLATQGTRKAPPATGNNLTAAELRREATRAMKEWYLEWIEEHYDAELADATTADEKRRLRESRAIDRDFDNNEIMGDEYDYYENALAGDEIFRDDHGRVIPHTRMEVFMLSMVPEFAGIGLSKVFLFDKLDGSIIDESHIID